MLIKKRRQEIGIRTQADLAALVGTSKTSVAKWESGVYYPSRYLGKLEAVLRIDLTGAEDPVELEIRELAARLDLSAAEEQRLVDRHRANRRRAEPGQELAS